MRFAVVTAIARSLPAWTCGTAVAVLLKKTSVWPPMVSVSAGPVPLYGIWFILTPAMLAKSSVARWITLPCPDEAKFTWPGLLFASAMSSFVLFTGNDGRTTTTKGPWDIWMIGVMSATGSKWILY